MKQRVEVTLPNNTKQIHELLLVMKDNMVKMESSAQGVKNVTYYYDSIQTTYILTDFMGTKKKQVINEETKNSDLKKEGVKSVNVAFTNEQKDILGFICKKAVLTIEKDAGTETRTIWYAPSLVPSIAYDFGITGMNKVKGLVLQYENKLMNLLVVHTVVELDLLSPVSKDEFAIPSGY